jgi:hypothetical protein
MSSPGFEYFKRPADRPYERLERNAAGDTLKKYGGTSTSWPTHSVVQSHRTSHQQQQAGIHDARRSISDFMSKNF